MRVEIVKDSATPMQLRGTSPTRVNPPRSRGGYARLQKEPRQLWSAVAKRSVDTALLNLNPRNEAKKPQRRGDAEGLSVSSLVQIRWRPVGLISYPISKAASALRSAAALQNRAARLHAGLRSSHGGAATPPYPRSTPVGSELRLCPIYKTTSASAVVALRPSEVPRPSIGVTSSQRHRLHHF